MAAMTLDIARTIVQRSVRNGTDTSAYSTTDLDLSIASLCQRFCRITQYLKTSTDFTVAAGIYSLGTIPDTLDPHHLMSVTCSGVIQELNRVPWAALVEAKTRNSLQSATPATLPRIIAFRDQSYGEVFPAPNVAATVTLRYSLPFTTWTLGTATPTGVTLNLPAELLYEILPCGCRKFLQENEPENRKAAMEAWQDYLAIERTWMGEGTLGEAEAPRQAAW